MIALDVLHLLHYYYYFYFFNSLFWIPSVTSAKCGSFFGPFLMLWTIIIIVPHAQKIWEFFQIHLYLYTLIIIYSGHRHITQIEIMILILIYHINPYSHFHSIIRHRQNKLTLALWSMGWNEVFLLALKGLLSTRMYSYYDRWMCEIEYRFTILSFFYLSGCLSDCNREYAGRPGRRRLHRSLGTVLTGMFWEAPCLL